MVAVAKRREEGIRTSEFKEAAQQDKYSSSKTTTCAFMIVCLKPKAWLSQPARHKLLSGMSLLAETHPSTCRG